MKKHKMNAGNRKKWMLIDGMSYFSSKKYRKACSVDLSRPDLTIRMGRLGYAQLTFGKFSTNGDGDYIYNKIQFTRFNSKPLSIPMMFDNWDDVEVFLINELKTLQMLGLLTVGAKMGC